ncbi:2OG-Fe(II) oxygenase [Paenibacillus protaetiae]|uniref:2OG-Fe(II) oxygenase n=1 Tax=Paenibacillus protaetiae TaxID=2509456 RepID=A0A4P6ESM9_9BACL|nr:2OG-Fe(II) oxygenase [Paenibacillus protaetiae]QAY65904.1 2OG-Fe(II) oxygenase [Paenibacillus protaetiae]
MATREQTIFQASGNKLITQDRDVYMAAKWEEPLILILDNVLSAEECDILIAMAKDRMQRARIGVSRVVSEVRTSSSMFFEEGENEWIRRIEARAAELMSIPLQHAEPLQILHYRAGEQYQPHFDYFSNGSADNRISTLIMYLNDVEEGGETYFPSLGLSVMPRKGSAVYFEYFYKDSRLNELTLHAGVPVVSGEKWVATQWMRRQVQRHS